MNKANSKTVAIKKRKQKTKAEWQQNVKIPQQNDNKILKEKK